MPILVGCHPLLAVVIMTTTKEEVRRSSIKTEKSVEGEGWGQAARSNKHRTFSQETARVKPKVNSEYF